MDPKQILINLREELKDSVDEKTKLSSKHFFKEQVKPYGIKSSVLHQINLKYFDLVKNFNKTEVFKLCEDLWKSDYLEETFLAANWASRLHKEYIKDDIKTFETWNNTYVNNWASCDTFNNHATGALVEMYPELITELKRWAKSANRWVKRASAVSLILPARHGKFLKDVFEIADILLLDKDDMVQKGYGWMLKAASETHQKEVFDYVVKNKAVMPRTSLRYAIEKMPKELKVIAMQK